VQTLEGSVEVRLVVVVVVVVVEAGGGLKVGELTKIG
jgi:hypothetical protein